VEPLGTLEIPAPQAHPGGTPLGYMPQLDGLRAVAVIGVWFEHWGVAQEPGFRYVEWGRLAVWLFFVLSGFLITGILLKSKRDVDDGRQDLGRAARVFYIRRFLRILPIYYVTLFAAAVAVPEVRKAFVWHLTYTTDFWLSLHPDQYPAGVHFWTLAVEEQFYLLWPWLVLLLSLKRLPGVLLALIFLSIIYRMVIVFSGIPTQSPVAVPLPLLGNVDKFAMGSLIAVYQAQGESSRVRNLTRIGLAAGLPLLVLLETARCLTVDRHGWRVSLLNSPNDLRLTFALTSFVAGWFFVWMVTRASTGFRGALGRLLSARPVILVGKISFGLYLFHMFTPAVLQRARIPLPPPRMVWPRFFIYAAATLVAGAISWRLIESPLNSLKNRFRYSARRPAVIGVPEGQTPGVP
jgi:peptidoglycan/LPS O-acetylase OafA/YrhL